MCEGEVGDVGSITKLHLVKSNFNQIYQHKSKHKVIYCISIDLQQQQACLQSLRIVCVGDKAICNGIDPETSRFSMMRHLFDELRRAVALIESNIFL